MNMVLSKLIAVSVLACAVRLAHAVPIIPTNAPAVTQTAAQFSGTPGTLVYQNTTPSLRNAYLNNSVVGSSLLGSTITTANGRRSTGQLLERVYFTDGSAGLDVRNVSLAVNVTSNFLRSVTTHLRFYTVDPSTSLPTTLLGGVDLQPLSLLNSNTNYITHLSSQPNGLFTIPASESVFVGLSFSAPINSDNSGLTSLTALTATLFRGPTVGFNTTNTFTYNASSSTINVDNPTLTSFGDITFDSPAHLGFTFAIPEPSAVVLISPLSLLLLRRRT